VLALVVLCCVLSVLVVVCEGRFGGVLKEQEEHISQEMASKFGALAGAAVAAVGALCSYEARVLHLHSSPGESFQLTMAEVLGCKEGCCPPGPHSEAGKDSFGNSSANLLPHFDGPNSYETLLFAPRY